MHEVWKRKQIHEDAKENAQDQKSCRKAWKNGEDDLGEVTTWSEEWTGRVQKVFGLREAKSGTETHALLQTGTDGHPSVWQNVEEDPSPGRRQAPSKGCKKLEDRRTKDKNNEERVSEASKQV